jgi:hypothetical protein
MADIDFGKKARIAFSFADAAGAPAKVDGIPVVTTTLGTVVEVVAAGDGFSALVDLGGVGAAHVAGTADVDLGAGVKTLAFDLADLNGLPSPEAAAVTVGGITQE